MMNTMYFFAATSSLLLVLGVGGMFIENTRLGKRLADKLVELLER